MIVLLMSIFIKTYTKKINFNEMQNRAGAFEKKHKIPGIFKKWIETEVPLIFINNTPKDFRLILNDTKNPETGEIENIKTSFQLTPGSMYFVQQGDYQAQSYTLQEPENFNGKGEELFIDKKDLGVGPSMKIPRGTIYIIEINCTKKAIPGFECGLSYDWAKNK